MPSYLYGCPECGATEMMTHSIMQDPVLYCGKCSCQMVRKPQVNGVSFRGEGWAHKDNGGKK